MAPGRDLRESKAMTVSRNYEQHLAYTCCRSGDPRIPRGARAPPLSPHFRTSSNRTAGLPLIDASHLFPSFCPAAGFIVSWRDASEQRAETCQPVEGNARNLVGRAKGRREERDFRQFVGITFPSKRMFRIAYLDLLH